jgi:hypothetical protein
MSRPTSGRVRTASSCGRAQSTPRRSRTPTTSSIPRTASSSFGTVAASLYPPGRPRHAPPSRRKPPNPTGTDAGSPTPTLPGSPRRHVSAPAAGRSGSPHPPAGPGPSVTGSRRCEHGREQRQHGIVPARRSVGRCRGRAGRPRTPPRPPGTSWRTGSSSRRPGPVTFTPTSSPPAGRVLPGRLPGRRATSGFPVNSLMLEGPGAMPPGSAARGRAAATDSRPTRALEAYRAATDASSGTRCRKLDRRRS